MGRFRRGAFFGLLAGAGIIAASAWNCAAPTQIIVEVRAEPVLCSGANAIRQTGIAVSTPERIDSEPLKIFQEGGKCHDGDMIGTLTITPSGAKDAEVGIRIVAGVTKQAHQCHGPTWDGCILARRRTRFRPNETEHITVYLSAQCIGKGCGDQECHRGACVEPEEIQPDGGLVEPKDDGGTISEPPDASEDVWIVEAGADACTVCTGNGLTCSAGSCTIDCNIVSCRYRTLCADGLDCTFKCDQNGACENLRCATSGTCNIQCTGGPGKHPCTNVQCAGGTCNVTCSDDPLVCNGLYVDGGTNDIECRGNVEPSCDDVHCRGGVCKRTCGPDGVACGPRATCEGACGDFQFGPDGGGGEDDAGPDPEG